MAEVSATPDVSAVHVQVDARLAALRGEFEAGEQRMRELELEMAKLRDRMLMLSGAIQALDEVRTSLSPANGLGSTNGQLDP